MSTCGVCQHVSALAWLLPHLAACTVAAAAVGSDEVPYHQWQMWAAAAAPAAAQRAAAAVSAASFRSRRERCSGCSAAVQCCVHAEKRLCERLAQPAYQLLLTRAWLWDFMGWMSVNSGGMQCHVLRLVVRRSVSRVCWLCACVCMVQHASCFYCSAHASWRRVHSLTMHGLLQSDCR